MNFEAGIFTYVLRGVWQEDEHPSYAVQKYDNFIIPLLYVCIYI